MIERFNSAAVGAVEAVSPSEIRVVLDVDAPQATALNTGAPTAFPRINGYLLIPVETGAVVGVINWINVERSQFPKRTGLKDFDLVDLPFPLRKIGLTPVGTLALRQTEGGHLKLSLERGVSAYPSVGDSALLPNAEELQTIVVGESEPPRIQIGSAPLAADAPVFINPDKLFGRHLAVLGNTGGGKSCTVAGLVRWSLDAARQHAKSTPNARIIILDPNGEYATAFSDVDPPPRVFSVSPGTANRLAVPAWIWNSHEWAAFAAAAPGTQRPLLIRALRNLRSGVATAEPVHIQVKRVIAGYRWLIQEKLTTGPPAYAPYIQRKETGLLLIGLGNDADGYANKTDGELRTALETLVAATRLVIDERQWRPGDFNSFEERDLLTADSAMVDVLGELPASSLSSGPSEDAPVSFDVKELSSHLEFLAAHSAGGAQLGNFIATLIMRIEMMLADHRLGPLVSPSTEKTFVEWLSDIVGADGASNGNIAIVDCSLISAEILHLVVAVLARVTFEAIQRYMKLEGKELPTILVLEEAHTFVHVGRASDESLPPAQLACREIFEKIAREGRKFGMSLVLSSQRPSEISPTALAQCNTFILHRLVNDRDQALVGRLVPDNLGGLLAELPSLPTRQAIILGWASPVPVLVEISDLPEKHRPRSRDPKFWDVWTGSEERPIDWGAIAEDWVSFTPFDATNDPNQTEPSPEAGV